MNQKENSMLNKPAQDLIDPQGRKIDYLRLSVTDKCNLRCFYCIPEGCRDFEKRTDYLSFEEIERLVGVLATLGLKRIRFTGGEPLVRKQLDVLIEKIAAIPGIEDISLSTNAVMLSDYAKKLKIAGVTRLNVSLDSLDSETFEKVTQGGDLKSVLEGLKAAKNAGFQPVKINMLALKGLNDHEIFDMVDYCAANDFTLRFIEAMPMGDTGRLAQDHFLDLREVEERLAKRYNLLPATMSGGGPARYVKLAGTDLRIGFITPISRHFCATCNRVRLSVTGMMYLCLGQEHTYSFREILRDREIDDEGLTRHILKALALKPVQHDFVKDKFKVNRIMSATGG